MKIKFGTTTIDIPGDVEEIQIVLHKNDQITYAKTNHEDYVGLILRNGDRYAEVETPAWFGESPVMSALPHLLCLKAMRKSLEDDVRRQISKE